MADQRRPPAVSSVKADQLDADETPRFHLAANTEPVQKLTAIAREMNNKRGPSCGPLFMTAFCS
ncbi:hypothetical protein ICW23_07100 [Bacillus sp. 1021]|uniref:hypothetical protein n=1 Tax=Bacillus sp. 1021 TaxID=2770510 RepID=UPI00165EF99E|nr:hypothetical protein [Bacillus sp. 1021]MBD0406918.1 hypothetical protein [Bacillus sp. 1021]